MRCDKKLIGLLSKKVYYNIFNKITNRPFQSIYSPCELIYFCICFCRSWKHLENSSSSSLFTSLLTALLISSEDEKYVPVITLFSLGKSQKSHCARSGEYGGWSRVVISFLTNSYLTLIALCAGALSWWTSHDLSLHSARLLRQTRL